MDEFSYFNRINNLILLNCKLTNIIIETSNKLISYAKKHNIELPYEIKPLLEEAEKYIKEIKYPTNICKSCSVCGNLNLDNADFCCYCGSSLNIINVSPDLLHGKNDDDKSPDKRQNLLKTAFKYENQIRKKKNGDFNYKSYPNV